MSMNLHVRLDGAGVLGAADLWQTPSYVTRAIIAHRTWQEQARAYLAWVAEQRADDLASKNPVTAALARADVKDQRRAIGRLWRLAEQGGGRMLFYAA